MLVQTLELTDFRNYADVRLSLGPGRFIVRGDNAQGKSNLCEALRLLATMRSFRAGSDRELVRWGAPGHFARVRAAIDRAEGPLDLEMIISLPPETAPGGDSGAGGAVQKRVRVNGTPRRALDAVGLFTAVLFEPADLDLVTGAPGVRRHFLDITLCQISRSYCRALSLYQKVIAQRSALLRRIREHQDDPRALEYWDEQLAGLAVAITTERAGLVARCNPRADDVARLLGGGGLRLEYRASFDGDPLAHPGALAEEFRRRLTTLRRREIAQGVNLLGPHRDDLGFFDGLMDLAIFGSRGQQRSAALALKLAELEAMEAERGDQPVLILDDVLSELDPRRRAALLACVVDLHQVILTTAEPESIPFAFADQAVSLVVRSGLVSALGE